MINNTEFQLKTEGDAKVNALFILPNDISEMNWKRKDYLNCILNMSVFESKEMEHQNLAHDLGTIFEADKKKINLETAVIGESPEYLYEIMWDTNS